MTAEGIRWVMPAKRRRILILGGTGEARHLAGRAVEILPNNVEVISSYAGRTARAKDPPGTVREGGFGGASGLANYLRDANVDMVIDATHPFAAAISAHAATAAIKTGRPHLILRRPDWVLPKDAQTTFVSDMATAARQLAASGSRAFLSTGGQELDAFAGIPNVWFLVRLISEPQRKLPLDNYAVITGRPPFSESTEARLLRENDIDIMVSKHSGGILPAKITAAVAQDIPLILIRQPSAPFGAHLTTIDDAIAWIQDRL